MNSKAVGLLLAVTLTAGCAQAVTSGAFTQVHRLGTELKRGASTKMDVRRVLGTPKGMGHAVLPLDPRPREVWFYSDIEVTQLRGEGRGVLRADVRQQILLVFFQNGLFDGFMWYSSAAVATTQ